MVWGGSGIEEATFNFIRSILPSGRVLEYGAGTVSTPNLMRHYDVVSVEHNPEYAMINPQTILCEANGWYDVDKLKGLGKFDLCLIDGLRTPTMKKHYKLMDATHIIIHDTYRDFEKELAEHLSKKLKKKLKFYSEGDYFAHLW